MAPRGAHAAMCAAARAQGEREGADDNADVADRPRQGSCTMNRSAWATALHGGGSSAGQLPGSARR